MAAPRPYLYVEDDPAVREAVVSFLAMHGLEVEACGSAGEARRAVESTPYLAMVCDQDLPDGSGRELIDELLREESVRTAMLATARMPEGAEEWASDRPITLATKPVRPAAVRDWFLGAVEEAARDGGDATPGPETEAAALERRLEQETVLVRCGIGGETLDRCMIALWSFPPEVRVESAVDEGSWVRLCLEGVPIGYRPPGVPGVVLDAWPIETPGEETGWQCLVLHGRTGAGEAGAPAAEPLPGDLPLAGLIERLEEARREGRKLPGITARQRMGLLLAGRGDLLPDPPVPAALPRGAAEESGEREILWGPLSASRRE